MGKGGMAMVKTYEELELKDDFMFSVIMRDPKYVKPFLETILRIKIAKIEYPEVQKNIDIAAGAKGIRLDVYVEDEKHTVFNLEMQTTTARNLPKRMRYYQGMIDLNILEKGDDYNHLKKSYVIFISTFDPFGLGRHIYTFENRCSEDIALTLNDGTVKIILNTKGTLDDVSPEMKRLLDYVDGKGVSDTFTRDLEEAVQKAEKELEQVKIEDEVSDVICDQCGRHMVIKYGPHGKFLACPGFPECRNTKTYFEKIGVSCPKCGKDIVIRKTQKGRKYYGCEDNPECDFMTWQRPSGKICPKCGNALLIKGQKLVCADVSCGYRENIEETGKE